MHRPIACRSLSALLLAALLLAVLLALAACGDDTAKSGTATPSGEADSAAPDAPLGDDSTAPDTATADTLTLDTATADSSSGGDCPGGAGCACKDNTDCQTGLCIDDPAVSGGKACAKKCEGACSDGYACAAVPSASGDIVSICVPKYLHLCEPCATSKDCAALGLKDAACVDQGGLGRYCGVSCSAAGDCPGGYACAQVPTAEGGSLQQCVRAADDKQQPFGVCPCSDAAVQKKLATACYVEVKDEAGKPVGQCKGTRSCTAAGLGACTATGAKAEVCNGEDDDCDGQVDEASCDDGKPCTKDVCDAAKGCQHTELDGDPCDADGSVCTVGDACKGGVCVAGAKKDCDDKNPCTQDSCDLAKGCTQVADDGKPCDADGTACTAGDTCQGSACKTGALTVCDDGNPCTIDKCDPKTGQCVTTSEDDGVPCDDGTKCTSKDQCKAGSCKGTAVSCDDSNPCTDDVCDKAAGCSPAPLTGSPCSDDNPCTIGDLCETGSCKPGQPKVCASPNSCVLATCDLTQNGACTFENADAGTPCDDGSACTDKDGCASGKCKGILKNCDDGNACTDDSCDAKLGCSSAANTAPCDADSSACTVGDTCKDKACIAGTKKACDDGQFCTADSCDAKTGQCVFTPLQAGTACDADGSACTENDACQAGNCTAGKLKICDDANPCTDDGCDAKLGCTTANNSSPCSDGNACTLLDKCAGGKCGGEPMDPKLDCDDGNPCTTESCEPKAGCVYSNNQFACDDGNPCTQGDQCAAGSCVGGSNTCGCQNDSDCSKVDDADLCNGVLYCDKSVPGQYACKTKPGSVVQCNTELNTQCSQQVCDPALGKCGAVSVVDGKGCDADGSVCTSGDACKAGVCAPGGSVDCDDKNPCTTDSCDGKLGCAHLANTAPCDADGSACTVGDTCVDKVCLAGAKKLCDDGEVCTTDSCNPGSGNCIFDGAPQQGKACDADGSVCTSGDACAAGKCAAGGSVDCDDKNPCTTDSCDAKTGCVHMANTAPCDADNNACTVGDTCADKVCLAGAKKPCDDGEVCTTDSCNPATGNCIFDGAPQQGSACDADGSLCTVGDSCQAGKCAPGQVKVCNDSNPCTDDSCAAKTGCVFAPNTQPCDDGNACTQNDLCAASSCVGKSLNPQVDCDDGQVCTTDACDPKSGCTHSANQLACDDGNPCTQGDLCAAKACTPGSNVCGCQKDSDCATQEDGDLCNGTLFCDTAKLPYTCKVKVSTVVVCDTSKDTTCATNLCAAQTGKCSLVSALDGKGCDADGSVCTSGDSCAAGLCKAGASVDCDDKNPCTTDSCDAKTGCAHANNALPCDADGSVCTVADACTQGLCKQGAYLDCEDNNVCTDDSCDAKTGCLHVNNTAGCSDGSACTSGDVCAGAKCAGVAVTCDDKDPCTADSCDVAKGCVAVPLAEKADCAADGKSWCLAGKCVAKQVCGNGIVEAGEECDDGNAANGDGCDGCKWKLSCPIDADFGQGSGPFVQSIEGSVAVVAGALRVERSGAKWGHVGANTTWLSGRVLVQADVSLTTSAADASIAIKDFVKLGNYNLQDGYHLVLANETENGNPAGLMLLFNSDQGNAGMPVQNILTVYPFLPKVGVVYNVGLTIDTDGKMTMYLNGSAVGVAKDVRASKFNHTYLNAGHDSYDGPGGVYDNVRVCVGYGCGDEAVSLGEQCDDGNKVSGDGCSSTCQLEPFASCKAILAKFPNTPDGVYPIDPDGAGPIAAANLFCDMKNGGWTLVGNYYDSAGDDMPNTTDYVVSGWQQTGSGKWDAKASTVDRAWGGGTGSGAVSMAFVEALGKAAGQKNLKMCFVHQNGYDTTCRQSSDGSLTLVSYNTGNPKLTAYASDKLTYTFGRLGGLAGSVDGYDYSKFSLGVNGTGTYQVPRTPDAAGVKYLFGVEGVATSGLNERPDVDEYGGVWHGWGDGGSFRPSAADNAELNYGYVSNKDPTPNAYGFRLYIGPDIPSYTSCKAALTANPAAQDGVYLIDPDGPNGPQVGANLFCDMKNGGWTLASVGGACTAVSPLAHVDGDTKCGYVEPTVMTGLAAVVSQVKLTVGSSFGSWVQSVEATNSKALDALKSGGNWHNGATWTGNWQWSSCNTPNLATGWPNMFHGCGDASWVHWILGPQAYFQQPGAAVVYPSSATWLR